MNHVKKGIAVGILIFVNFLFTYKYTARFTDFGVYIAIGIALLQLLSFVLYKKIRLSPPYPKVIGFSLLAGIVGLGILTHFAIPLESLRVDRWSVISSFLTELYQGNYPYYATSHMGNYPGPMPVYFLIAAPFQFLGELNILSCIGYGMMAFLLMKKAPQNRHRLFLFFYLLTAFFLIWEIAVRSNLFTFSVLIVWALYTFETIQHKSALRFFGLAILIGLLLSTRSVYILPYIIFFASYLLNREITFLKLFYFLSVACITFICTFIPLVYVFPNDFFEMNPFIIQSSFLIPSSYTFAFIALAIVFTFLVKDRQDRYFYSGLSLFLTILIYAMYHIVNFGYTAAFIESNIDISYFIFSLPFLMRYLMLEGKEIKSFPL